MPDKRGATLLEDLPEEIIDKILVRLPSKDVGRCRVVSPLWRSVTSTSEFMLEHHRHQPSLPIINGWGKPASFVILRNVGAGISSQQLWPFVPGHKHHFENCLEATCDGFLVISRSQRSRFYMCNPVTRKHTLLPQPRFGQGIRNTIHGFYRHVPTGQYRVLWVSNSNLSSKSSLYVHTVGSDELRQIRVRMATASSPSLEQEILNILMNSSSYCPPPVHHLGSLHWCPYDTSDIMGDGGEIIVFDTEVELFRRMGSPLQAYNYRDLFNMDGMLAFRGSSSSFLDIWVMQDYEAENWNLKYRIDVSTVEASRQVYLTSYKKKKNKPLDSVVERLNGMVMLNKRELLISFNSKHVLHCDIDGKFLGIVNIGKSQYCMVLTRHRLQESIIPVPSHEIQEDEESPFSMGHV